MSENNKKHNLKASLDVKLQVQKLITSPVKVGVEGSLRWTLECSQNTIYK